MRPKLSPPPRTPPLASTPRPPGPRPLLATAAAIGLATGGCTAIGREAFRGDAGEDAPVTVNDAGTYAFDAGRVDAPAEVDAGDEADAPSEPDAGTP